MTHFVGCSQQKNDLLSSNHKNNSYFCHLYFKKTTVKDENIIALCKKVISGQELSLDELNGFILLLSHHYQDRQILHLYSLYPRRGIITALLWEFMHTRRLTRRQFAEKLGLSYYQLGALLRGKSRMSIETARRLHNLNVDANFILRNY